MNNNSYTFFDVKQHLRNIKDSQIAKWCECHSISDPSKILWTDKQFKDICDFFSNYRSDLDMDEPVYDTRMAHLFIGSTDGKIQGALRFSPELKPKKKQERAYRWTLWEINRLAVKVTGKDINLNDVGCALESDTVLDMPYTGGDNILSEIDELLDVQKRMWTDSSIWHYMRAKEKFNSYTEKDLSVIFGELLRRFKFSYIVENVQGCQTQTLTAIKQGSLKGLDRFKMSFEIYLRLIKFAKENGCPILRV